MSRVFIVLLGLTLLSGVAWAALTVHTVPYALLINAAVGELLNGQAVGVDFADAIFDIGCVLAAMLIGSGTGWSLRSVTADANEADLQRRLIETKGRIPQLEAGMHNRELYVARAEEQLRALEAQLPPLRKIIEERDAVLRERDRTVSKLEERLAALKHLEDANPTPTGMDIVELNGIVETSDGIDHAVADRHAEQLAVQVAQYEARIAQLTQDSERQRVRQEKWLDILNDQLARARETNDRLTAQSHGEAALRARIAELEAEVARLRDEISERERRLAASRFECSTARTTIAHLQAQLANPQASPLGAG